MYFGRPGALFEIPHPRGGVRSTRDRPASVFRTAGGQARVGKNVDGVRQYVLQWEQLWYETFAQLEAFDQGHEGPGPFALIDPGRINMLTANQSSATSVYNDTSNFTISGSGSTLSSSQVTYDRGPRSLAWTFAFTATGSCHLDSPSVDWPGIPVVSGVALVFSLTAKGAGTDAVMSVTPKLEWYNTSGTLLSSNSGSALTTNSSAFQAASATATPPASAAYVLCKVDVTGQTAGSILYLDKFQLEAASTPTSWRPGTGVMPVAVMSVAEAWPWEASTFREGPVMTLQEVT